MKFRIGPFNIKIKRRRPAPVFPPQSGEMLLIPKIWATTLEQNLRKQMALEETLFEGRTEG